MRAVQVTLVTAIAVASLMGSAIAAVAQSEASAEPSPETESVAPTWVTGSMQHVDGSCSQTGSSARGGVTSSSYQCTFAWTSSDPRLTGDASRLWNEDVHEADEGAIAVGTDASFLRNEGGHWACSYSYLVKGSSPDQEDLSESRTHTCIGSGGYEGLSAVLVSKPAEGFSDEFVGLIFSGDLPPLPEAPAAG